MVLLQRNVVLTQGKGRSKMHRSRQASVMVKAMVASNPNGQLLLMVSSDCQFASKSRPQSKMNPNKKMKIHAAVRIIKTRDVI